MYTGRTSLRSSNPKRGEHSQRTKPSEIRKIFSLARGDETGDGDKEDDKDGTPPCGTYRAT
jgi:hypothetical protein